MTFIRLLHKHAVRYLMVGGEAVIFHGHSRLTGDVDFFFDAEGDNTSRFFKAFDEFWACFTQGKGGAFDH